MGSKLKEAGISRKSIIGTTGKFDLNDKNIYRSLFPWLIGGTSLYLLNNK